MGNRLKNANPKKSKSGVDLHPFYTFYCALLPFSSLYAFLDVDFEREGV
jgi:hypothetical protein